jgi:hypothetical protein
MQNDLCDLNHPRNIQSRRFKLGIALTRKGLADSEYARLNGLCSYRWVVFGDGHNYTFEAVIWGGLS